jgi:hypothetical protein
MTLLEIAQVAFDQLNPKPSDETALDREHFISAAKTEFAWQMWRQSKEEAAMEGEYNPPSYLLTEKDFEVMDNEIDLTEIEFLKSLTSDTAIRNVGGLNCECLYVRTNTNLAQIFCDDDSSGDVKKYLLIGKKIRFLDKPHKDKLPIIYVNNGHGIDDQTEVDESLAKLVGDYLIQRFGGKVAAEDTSNNSNPNQ